MTYETREGHSELGRPVELFELTIGLTVWRLTSHDVDLVYGGNTYVADAIRAEPQRTTGEEEDGGIVLRLPITHALAPRFLAGDLSEPVGVTIILSHADILGTGVGFETENAPFRGQVESVQKEGRELRLLCLPATSLLRRRVPNHEISVVCYNTLYDSLCGVDRNTFLVSGVIDGISDDLKTITVDVSPFLIPSADYFQGGWLTHLGSGRRQAIEANPVGGTTPELLLIAPIKGMRIGDAVELLPGCKHDEVDCQVKFGNGARFGGFARIPSRDSFRSGVQ